MSQARLLGSVLALASYACVAPAPETTACDVLQTRAPIINGSSNPGLFQLSASAEHALVAVSGAPDARAGGLCSAVRIAPEWILTAAHCVEAAELWYSLEPGREGSFMPVVRVVTHPEADLALLETAADASGRAARIPVVQAEAEPRVQLLGTAVMLAGFGISFSETLSVGSLRYAVEVVTADSGEMLSVDGRGLSGACAGDSGGPLLARADDGSLRVFGTLSQGSSSCVGVDEYVALAVHGSWLREIVGDVAFEPAPGCDGVGALGECVRNNLVTCDGTELQAAGCGEDQRCGRLADDATFRCLGFSETSCGAVTERGSCEDDVALRCSSGELTSRDCGACGLTCVLDSASGVATCATEAG